MIARRIFIPSVLILTILAQFMPVAVVGSRPAAAVTRCDWAQFVGDITVPDGTSFAPGTAFTKTWRLRNIGTCTWTTSYALVFVSGSQMGAPSVVNLTSSVAPNGTIDISVNMTAPAVNGHYRGNWQLRNASGVLFGIGTYANSSFWVDINVSVSYAVAYDFVANYCSAIWTSGAGTLPCPGTDGNANGFVLKLNTPTLENGVTDSSPGLLTVPQNVTDGFIQGVYPAFTVQAGDHFQSIVNCQYGATSCYVTFRLDYQIGSGPVYNFWSFKEKYEGSYYRADRDLSSLAGQSVKFILTVRATGSPTGDRALWGAPRIVRGGAVPPPPTPTSTGTPPTPTSTPTTGPVACDRATFISDISIPDGTTFTGGTPFTKTWRFRNDGSCTWTTSYALVFVSGDAMSAISVNYLSASIAPGQYVNLSVGMTAPNTTGHYRGYWKLRNASGVQFGIGPSGANPFWVDINVVGPNSTTTTIKTDTPDPSTPGQAVAVSVSVSGSGTTPTGTVAITGADTNCTISLASGSGSCNAVFNTVGAKTITATYSGDANYVSSVGTASHTVSTPGPVACDRATFISDISIPDGTTFAGGTPFTKTWRFRNDGTCTWTTSYALVFVSGDAMSAISVNYLSASVAPGQYVNLSVGMTAPNTTGHYHGYWKLRNASGVQFGIGPSGTNPFWVDINVSSAYTTAYDFYTNACFATWSSGWGTLPCPGTDADAHGFVLTLAAPVMEDGTTGSSGLLTFPQNVTDGYIQGIYPAFTVQSGDRFQTLINCEHNAVSCNVIFRLNYQIAGGPIQVFKTYYENYEGMYYRVDVSLSSLAGQSVKFILTVLANGSPTGDRALWIAPRIVR